MNEIIIVTLRSDRIGAKRIHYASLRFRLGRNGVSQRFDRCDIFTSQRSKLSLRELVIATTHLRRGDIIHWSRLAPMESERSVFAPTLSERKRFSQRLRSLRRFYVAATEVATRI